MASQLSFYKTNTGDLCTDARLNQLPKEDKEIILYSLETAGYLIKRGETITAEDYAKRIEEVYSTENPRTNAIVTALKSYKKGLSK